MGEPKICIWTVTDKRNTGALKTVFRCSSPFEIETHITLKKLVWADFSCKTLENVYYQFLYTKKNWGYIWIFVEVVFFYSSEIEFFWTNMESNAAVTLHFDLTHRRDWTDWTDWTDWADWTDWTGQTNWTDWKDWIDWMGQRVCINWFGQTN